MEHATRATLLVDAAAYFTALHSALLQARHQILIAGWEVDSRTILLWQDPPVRLGELLGALVRRRPELRVHVTCWDHHLLYAKGREPWTARRLRRLGGERIQFCADDCHAVTGSVHHKLVVIDDAVAFCGGMDLTQRRWDTPAHVPADERRRDHAGTPYRPMHDTQLLVAGPIAAALGEHLRQRWRDLREMEIAPPPPVPANPVPWPQSVHVDFADVPVGIARTLPGQEGNAPVTEIRALYEHAIRASRRELYVENQYYTSPPIAQALTDALRTSPHLQGLLVCPAGPRTLLEHYTMGYGRVGFHGRLQEARALERLPLVAPCNAAGNPIIVHSKLAVFDDRLLLAGSANLNNRSMGFDAECNLAIEARSPAHRERMLLLRDRLLGEHLGRTAEEIAAERQACGGISALPARLADRPRKLLPVTPCARRGARHLGPLLCPVFDRSHGGMVPRWRSHALQPQAGLTGWSRVVLLVASTMLALALLGQSVLTDGLAARAALQHWSELF